MTRFLKSAPIWSAYGKEARRSLKMSDRIEVLIELVRDRPFLYNKADSGYKDAILWRNAWEAIAKEAGFKDSKHLRTQNTLLHLSIPINNS